MRESPCSEEPMSIFAAFQIQWIQCVARRGAGAGPGDENNLFWSGNQRNHDNEEKEVNP